VVVGQVLSVVLEELVDLVVEVVDIIPTLEVLEPQIKDMPVVLVLEQATQLLLNLVVAAALVPLVEQVMQLVVVV